MNKRLTNIVNTLDNLWQTCTKVGVFRALVIDIHRALKPYGITELDQVRSLPTYQLGKIENDLNTILRRYE